MASRPHDSENGSSSRDGHATSLDILLTDASGGGPTQRWTPGVAGIKAAAQLVARPQRVVRHSATFAAQLAQIAAGRSTLGPDKRDRRFKDPAWERNPLFKRLGQAYFAWAKTLDRMLADVELSWEDERRVRYAAENLVDALAPTNNPLLNPAVLKAIIETGGGNLAGGAQKLAADMRRPPRIPSMVDGSQFAVGENLAVTDGAVVLRTEMVELLQYRAQTERVFERPVLIVPSMINKYYITDLAPDRSLVQHLVESGHQVFVISWRNPDERFAGWGIDAYAEATLEAVETALAITAGGKAQVLGLCAGGTTLAIALAILAARGELESRVAGVTLGVNVIDNQRAGTTSAFADRRLAKLAIEDSARRGYLDGRALAGVFAWLRPNDLIWSYWVNNYLLGKDPPAFDVLYWNSDTTNMPAALHRDFIEMSLKNPLIHPGELRVLDTPIDLSQITTDAYVVAGISDHITPWENCYRTTQLLGSSPRFVLSTSGHIAAIVNPPDNEKASFQVNDHNPESSEEWLATTSSKRGSWWLDWTAWLAERSGDVADAPRELGSDDFPPLAEAPGAYVVQPAG